MQPMTTNRVMTLSRNGQVSVPAAVRTRWNTRRVIVVDLGDRVVMRPASGRPLEELRGRYRQRGPTADAARRAARAQEAARARQR